MAKLIKDSHVTIMVSNMANSIKFYTKTLGFSLEANYDNEWVEISAPGLLIGLHSGGNKKKSENFSIGFEVKNFDKTVKEFEKKGIKFKISNEDVIRLAYFKDPDNTELYLWEYT